MTNADLAKALDINERTLMRLHRQGLPLPPGRRPTRAWVLEAQAWRAAHRRQPGVPPAPKEQPPAAGQRRRRDWSAESSKALALSRMHALRVARGEVMYRAEVHREWVSRVMSVRTALLALPRALARRLSNATPDAIEEELTRAVHDILRAFAAPSQFTPTPGSPVAVTAARDGR